MKFDRYSIKDMSVGDLYNIFKNDRYDIFFLCINRENVLYRYRVERANNINDLKKMFEKNLLRRFESGLNSDEINVFESDYIDCYIKYPNK